MKNKHIVLLFIITVLVGLLLRQMPWKLSRDVKKSLLLTDSTSIQRINIQRPAFPELTLERTDLGWSVSQSGRFVNTTSAAVSPLLVALAEMELHQIIRTNKADTLGFSSKEAISIELFDNNNNHERIQIGRVILNKGKENTYILIPNHDGIYLVKGDFRTVFLRKIDQFRVTVAFRLDPKSVRTITISNQDTCFLAFSQIDSTKTWVGKDQKYTWSADSCATWIQLLQNLNNTPFADYFDEGHSAKLVRIELGILGQEEPLQLDIYQVKQTELPEEYKEQSIQYPIAPFVLKTSYNRFNYFALTDIALIAQILGHLPHQCATLIQYHAQQTR